MKHFYAFLLALFTIVSIQGQDSQDSQEIFQWDSQETIPNAKGLNGAFTGIHNDVLIFAGGANFPYKPVWEGGKKVWHDSVYVLEKGKNGTEWISNLSFKLQEPLANGVSISTPNGLLCIGGDNAQGVSNTVFLLQWNKKTKTIERQDLPAMPVPLANMGGGIVGDMVYLVGGNQTKTGGATASFLSFNLSESLNRKKHTWKVLPDFPGEARLQPVVVGQGNGRSYESLYVFSGLYYNPEAQITHRMLSDVFEFDVNKNSWIKKNNVPNNNTPGLESGYIAAAPAIKSGASHIVIFGGAGGAQQHLNARVDIWTKIKNLKALKSTEAQINTAIDSLTAIEKKLVKNTAFTKTIWAYHTITDTWSKRGEIPGDSQVVANALKWGDDFIIAGGETNPGVRTNVVSKISQKPYQASFGWINYVTLIVYLLLMVMMGWYFSRKNKTTDDYFLGGGRIPWWAAGLSIYATMLSAITYLAHPAIAYAFDWQVYLGYFTILLIVPIVVSFYLPFFRKLKVTTAYEYLEKRFHISVRMFGSLSFVLFQLARMGIVVYLPALAIATVVGIDIYFAIILMGILAIVYTYMGGMEAVIWTDVVQVIVLMAGLIVGLIFISIEIGDVGYIFETAYNDGKMQMFDFRFSFTEVVTWSLFLGTFAANFAPYTTDQAVVQRYMTTSSEKEARKSIWLNGIIAIPAGLLIFTMGAFLYVYFKENPEFLTVGMKNDGIFPLFITNHLPPGIAGLVIAGIFSASMSSLDSSMHSVSTVVTVDFYKRFYPSYSEVKGLKLAKCITVFVGVLGTLIACVMAAFPVQSLFFLFQEIIGLFGSSIAGVFILGIFIKKANWKGTLIGALLSILVLAFVKYSTPINFYIYPLIAIPVCVIGGYVFSMLLPVKQNAIENLVYSKKK
ncbi:sodium/solute symporter [Oceanihabitans sp. IOP_32]|uniref:sodium:solute symporter family transporter n=1 Tax=Oceanihabitans sp. IOP_32 TaxID=2529032 RepID=UPI001293FAC0|nr:sodium/solute symporter [Oceanihabitans sp. IOP_32]QFZ55623.1 sodium/solute symporter [Oceanihabitans sp. IOP_32]